jgi:hypothetical protein
MKMNALCLSVGLAVAVAAAPYAAAQGKPSKDERNLSQLSTNMDKDASGPDGQKRVEQRLKSEFKVDDARLQDLRGRRLGYGEMAIALSLAQRMPGGITDANMQTIMSMRQGQPPMGWGQICKQEGVSLGKVLAPMRHLDAGARAERAEGRKHDERGEKAGRSERPERSERPDRSDRIERQDRIERPENPRH